MKKVLILTTSTGQGHNQAANSLCYTFSQNGYEVEKLDFLYNNSKFLNNTIVGGYEVAATKLPHIYGLFYALTNVKYMNALLSVPFYITDKKMLAFINNIKPDIIVGTHPLTVNIISNLKKKGLIKIPFVSIVTDFKAHYTYISKQVDSYVTASSFTKNHLISRGIDANKIFDFGIPIKQDFFIKDEEISATKDNDYFNILLMSGSMGLDNISLVLKELIKNPNKLRITVVCGNNNHLKQNLLNKYGHPIKDKKIHILGFTNDVSALMDYSDVIISKPGGLTSTEAIVKNLPLIIPFAIPGQETENTEFLTEKGCAIYVKHIRNINLELNELIYNPHLLIKMRNNLKNIAKNYSINGIVNISNELLNKK
ncbi:processive 1,2-diacylglycerol beta-glucosyltransferase [Clostridium cavendishii DSM 21758]|uniref:Processive 1,2-diacylglycerol beta-glucosyltransferase n=1 Tax=Clostridium cavendishii DSM 21758 TaxID=1121302 RepID=A0A1M6U5K6_9CLOT|nr:glycosyltransferase [Clostridium cavendishii]SHK64454.1 processive 1,2-diacylglycerol beta-glucosyltransferase [Clostridium cavendishii DSM 21758]